MPNPNAMIDTLATTPRTNILTSPVFRTWG
jgi:hypothetical protein